MSYHDFDIFQIMIVYMQRCNGFKTTWLLQVQLSRSSIGCFVNLSYWAYNKVRVFKRKKFPKIDIPWIFRLLLIRGGTVLKMGRGVIAF